MAALFARPWAIAAVFLSGCLLLVAVSAANNDTVPLPKNGQIFGGSSGARRDVLVTCTNTKKRVTCTATCPSRCRNKCVGLCPGCKTFCRNRVPNCILNGIHYECHDAIIK
ncbi:hypothetical protein FCM35_KLT18006 [Carex littledalei]|uniref:Uncharacterized protein n=1 Tax=Carex littledalei TaxID=544730 RepID=A0A833R9C3_9POAL|nr:hypothetical protein FCM35_KLT18006 [Carex littledalei]